MIIHGIDGGSEQSAIVSWNGSQVVFSKIMPNAALLAMLRKSMKATVAIETIASYGMSVGKEIFETVEWNGRYREAVERNEGRVIRVYRREVKIHYCGTMKAKDANIRQALIDRLGAVGTMKEKGPLYGIASHLWSALAVADYAITTQPK